MGSGEKDGDGPESPVIPYHVSRVSQAAWPAYLRHSPAIKQRPLRRLHKAYIFAVLRRLRARLIILFLRSGFPRSRREPAASSSASVRPERAAALPETPMPAEPLIRVLETFDLSRGNIEEKSDQALPETNHSETA